MPDAHCFSFKEKREGEVLSFRTAALALVPTAARADWRVSYQPERRVRIVPVMRLYNAGIDDHLLTTDPQEADAAPYVGWNYEATVFGVAAEPARGLVPVYRYLMPFTGGHSYTTEPGRVGPQQRNETILGYVSPRPQPGLVPLYVWHNPDSGRYFYTLDREGELAPQSGYRPRGVLGYVWPLEERP
jgi:hypothetical protein